MIQCLTNDTGKFICNCVLQCVLHSVCYSTVCAPQCVLFYSVCCSAVCAPQCALFYSVCSTVCAVLISLRNRSEIKLISQEGLDMEKAVLVDC